MDKKDRYHLGIGAVAVPLALGGCCNDTGRVTGYRGNFEIAKG